ncbi:MAG: amino acid adenylation domain-containing protein [Clostridia bacterium]|nr:amino acid adenylation domain-containing protein [Clostridia bacterium]MDY5555111.1 amino acid adenylation domain-containing protein [Blautia sp.]
MDKIFKENTVTVTLPERVFSDNAPEIEKELEEYLSSLTPSPEKIVFDAADLTYISSVGLRILLRIRKKITDFSIINVSDEVYEVFAITGMMDVFGIEKKAEKKSEVKALHTHYTREKKYQPDIPLTGINDTTVDFDFVPVTRMFEEQVEKNPDKLAVVSSQGSYTYRELNEAANRVAHSLIYLGVGAEDVVCIMLERGISTYVATLGVLKAGAAYTIVNTQYPDVRIKYIFQDASCKQIISTRKIVYDRLELFVDELQKRPQFIEDLLSCPDKDNPDVDIQENDLCYCIYTSGSTGNPKGVMIEHGNLSNFLHPSEKNYELMGLYERGTVCLAMAQMTFDVSVMEEYIPLISGNTVAYALDDEIMNPNLMIDFLEKNKVDAMCVTPSYLSGLLKLPKVKDAFGRMKVLDLGAEAFPGTLYTRIREYNPDVMIMNGYGPTEATISCTMKVIDSEDCVTIGVPNANVYVFVIDENNKEVPKGEKGELLICGRGVGRGYINLPEKTNDVFIEYGGMRGYKSGDIVRINENDEIEYLGRRDNQVKLRGLRIELGEVEAAMSSMRGMNICTAAVIDNRYLCLYYACEAFVTEEEVHEFAHEHLAHYMMPDIWMRMDEMPMTANQKVDRKALPRPVIKEKEIVPPETEVQKKLVEIVENVLPDRKVGITTNLLELGVSSLDIMLLISMIGDEFNIGINVADIYDHTDILKLEEFVKNAPKLKTFEKKDRYPATMIQTATFYEMLQKGTNLNMPTLYQLDLSIDNERLKEAIYKTMEAHPGLTMRMEMGEDHAVYQIPQDDYRDYEIKVIHMDDETFDEESKHLSKTIGPMDKWLFCFEIIETGKRKFLFTDFSHLNSDGRSIGIVAEDIGKAYDGKELTSESYTMFELGEDLAEFWNTPAGEKCTQMYMKYMERIERPGMIPFDLQGKEFVPKRCICDLDASMEKIQEYCKKNRVSPNILMAGLLGMAFTKYCQHSNSAYIFGYNGRNSSQLKDTFGYIATTLMAYCYVGDYDSFSKYLQEFQKEIMDLMIFPTMPLIQLSEKCMDILSSAYIYQPLDEDTFEIGGTVAKGTFLEDNQPSDSLAVFQAEETPSGIRWVLDYHGELYSEEKMHALLEDINHMLNIALETDDMKTILALKEQ